MVALAEKQNTLADVMASLADVRELVTLPALSRSINVSPSTVFRWAHRGFPDGRGGRMKLPAVRKGRLWLTTLRAYEYFFTHLPTNFHDDAPAPRSPSERERAGQSAMEQLAARGI
jgi:hypothetical protein